MSVPNVQPAARSTLVSLVEDNLTSLVREAVIVQRHCKRARIHLPADAETEQEGIVKRRLHAEDINMALQWRQSEKIYATGIVGSNSSDEKKITLEDYLKSEMELRPPQEVGLTVHWLAVDGVQPDIPQNPAHLNRRNVHRVEQEENPNEADGGFSGVQVSQLHERLFSEELQLYLKRITTAVERGGNTPTTRKHLDSALSSLARDKGLQELTPIFVTYVAKNLFHNVEVGNPERCRTLVRMAHALLINPHSQLELHLHQLLPPLITCIVAADLSSNPWDNHWMLRKESALTLVNACNLFGDGYVSLKPRILEKLCKAVQPDKPLATQYGGIVGITLLGPRSINAFLLPLSLQYWNIWEQKLEASKPADGLQKCRRGIAKWRAKLEVAKDGKERLLCQQAVRDWERKLENEANYMEERLMLQMCQQAVLDAVGVFMGQDSSQTSEALQIDWEELEDTFGDRLVMRTNEQTEYSMCVI